MNLLSGWRLEADLQAPGKAAHPAPQDAGPYTAWLDGEALSFPLAVRSRRPGDRFRPLGLGGHSVKVSDYFINVKLPRRARESWPLVLSADGEIAWIPGFVPAHPFRLTGETRQVVCLRLSREEDAQG
jgi:tRNA(Ile)-lysidine synthase